MAAPVSAPAPVGDSTWGQAVARAEVGDIAAVEHFIAARPFSLNAIEILTRHAARGGQAELVRLLVTKYDADVAVALDNAVDAVEVNTIRGPHFDLIRWLLDPQPGEDPEDYEGRICDGFLESVVKGNLALASLFLDRVRPVVFSAGFNRAVRADNLHMMRFLFRRGKVNVTHGIESTNPTASDDVVRYLIEKGATNWPWHIYAHLSDSPELVIHLYKFGIPRNLLVCGYAPIQLILDEHDRWCAHVRETLDELGVYAVLANLIVQY